MYTFELQGNKVEITGVGESFRQDDALYAPVQFTAGGKQYERNILLAEDSYTTDPEEFYFKNEQQLTSNLIDFFSELGLYNNQN